ncbi:MAG: FtsX-like permease family protein, partial [Gemmatimonadaceae bacterium]
QRTREMGIRLALGAKPNGIVTLILREGLVFPTLGVVAGFFLALGTGRFLRSSLHGVAPSDPTVIAATMTLLWCAAVAACAIPALRATRLNPSDTLRAE